MAAVASLKTESTENPDATRSLWRDAVRKFVRDRLTLAAFITLIGLTLLCYLVPPLLENIFHIDATRTNTPNGFLAPGSEGHILGTDHLGRDQLIRLLYGGRISLAVAYASSVMIILIGVSLGLIAGYYGGLVDDLITWLVNTLSSVPTLLLYVVIAAIWQPPVEWMVIILAMLGWVGTSRLVRAEVLSIKEREYVLAARALGASDFRIIVQHIFPNLMSIVIVTGSIIAGNLILTEAGLSYLGVGVQPPTPTWGNMMTDARTYFVQGVHLVFWPGLLILVTVLCFYLIGDGLRDALDPHHTRHSRG